MASVRSTAGEPVAPSVGAHSAQTAGSFGTPAAGGFDDKYPDPTRFKAALGPGKTTIGVYPSIEEVRSISIVAVDSVLNMLLYWFTSCKWITAYKRLVHSEIATDGPLLLMNGKIHVRFKIWLRRC